MDTQARQPSTFSQKSLDSKFDYYLLNSFKEKWAISLGYIVEAWVYFWLLRDRIIFKAVFSEKQVYSYFDELEMLSKSSFWKLTRNIIGKKLRLWQKPEERYSYLNLLQRAEIDWINLAKSIAWK